MAALAMAVTGAAVVVPASPAAAVPYFRQFTCGTSTAPFVLPEILSNITIEMYGAAGGNGGFLGAAGGAGGGAKYVVQKPPDGWGAALPNIGCRGADGAGGGAGGFGSGGRGGSGSGIGGGGGGRTLLVLAGKSACGFIIAPIPCFASEFVVGSGGGGGGGPLAGFGGHGSGGNDPRPGGGDGGAGCAAAGGGGSGGSGLLGGGGGGGGGAPAGNGGAGALFGGGGGGGGCGAVRPAFNTSGLTILSKKTSTGVRADHGLVIISGTTAA